MRKFTAMYANNVIKQQRKAQNVPPKSLADLLNVSLATYYRLESGGMDLIQFGKVCNKLGIKLLMLTKDQVNELQSEFIDEQPKKWQIKSNRGKKQNGQAVSAPAKDELTLGDMVRSLEL